jgi:uncharacterized protein (TIRG00374 family)
VSNVQTPGDRGRRIAGALIALAAAVGLLVVARPIEVWHLLRATQTGPLLVAAACSGAALVTRAIRLVLLLPPGRLRFSSSIAVAATAHFAATFVPARLGELALPLLLRRAAGWETAAGVSTLLAARTLDVAAIGVGTGIAILVGWGLSEPAALLLAALLVVPMLLLPQTLALADWISLRTLAVRGMRGRRWARRVRQTRRALAELWHRPGRLAGAAAASLGVWICLWGATCLLLVAMGIDWAPTRIAAGFAVATIANLLPFNLVANFGTMEAGWTAGFVALGVPLETAAATGYACHAWGIVFAVGHGLVGWMASGALRER